MASLIPQATHRHTRSRHGSVSSHSTHKSTLPHTPRTNPPCLTHPRTNPPYLTLHAQIHPASHSTLQTNPTSHSTHKSSLPPTLCGAAFPASPSGLPQNPSVAASSVGIEYRLVASCTSPFFSLRVPLTQRHPSGEKRVSCSASRTPPYSAQNPPFVPRPLPSLALCLAARAASPPFGTQINPPMRCVRLSGALRMPPCRWALPCEALCATYGRSFSGRRVWRHGRP